MTRLDWRWWLDNILFIVWHRSRNRLQFQVWLFQAFILFIHQFWAASIWHKGWSQCYPHLTTAVQLHRGALLIRGGWLVCCGWLVWCDWLVRWSWLIECVWLSVHSSLTRRSTALLISMYFSYTSLILPVAITINSGSPSIVQKPLHLQFWPGFTCSGFTTRSPSVAKRGPSWFHPCSWRSNCTQWYWQRAFVSPL